MGVLTAGGNKDGDGSGTVDHAEGRTTDLSASPCDGCGFSALGECENRAGATAGRAVESLDSIL